MRDNQSAMRRFIEQHIEKVVLGGVAVLVGVMVYSGASVEGVDDTLMPENLKKKVSDARSHIVRDRWDEISKAHPAPVDLVDRTKNARTEINLNEYPLAMTFGGSNLQPPQQRKRRDPKLYPPTDIHVVSFSAALAMKAAGKDPLAALPDAPKKESEKKTDLMTAGGSSVSTQPINLAPGGSSAKPPRTTTSKKPKSSGDEDLFGGSGQPGMFGMGQSSAGMSRVLDAKYLDGTFRPQGLSGGPGGGQINQPGIPTGTDEEDAPTAPSTRAVSSNVVVIFALVPEKKQFEEYEASFKNAPFYNPARDVPEWRWVYVQRSDVTDDPNKPVNQLVWPVNATNGTDVYHIVSNLDKGIWASTKDGFKQPINSWEGVPDEMADPTFVHPLFTMSIPPVLMCRLDKIALHPKVPKISLAPKADESSTVDDTAKSLDDVESLPTDNSPNGTGGTTGPNTRPSNGPGRQAGMPAGGPPRTGMPSSPSRPSTPSREGTGSMVRQSGMQSGPGGMSSSEPPSEFKMIRFYDTNAEPGRVYRYRIRYSISDPNRPDQVTDQPSERTLDKDVLIRIRAVEKADEQRFAAARAKNPKAEMKRTSTRMSDWSEPTAPVAIPKSPDQILGGSVSLAKNESHGKVLALRWDPNFATWMPAEQSVSKGAYLNFTADSEIVHPLTATIKLAKNYKFHLNSLVADFRGGEAVTTKDAKDKDKDAKDELTSPGEFAFIDPQGNLIVRNELDDLEDYRRHTYAYEKDQEEQAALNQAGASTGMGGPGPIDIANPPPSGPGAKGGARPPSGRPPSGAGKGGALPPAAMPAAGPAAGPVPGGPGRRTTGRTE